MKECAYEIQLSGGHHTKATQLLLPDLGELYSRFYPAGRPWGQDISAPYSVVLEQEEPVTFLNLFYQAKQKRDEAVAFHSIQMLSNINFNQTEQIGDTLVYHVTADESSKALEAHFAWHLAMMNWLKPVMNCRS